MPLIFAQNEITESDFNYADVTGVQYQYPKRMYKNIIQPGERFIYYRGRRTSHSTHSPQVYFGTGIVGDIHTDSGDTSRLICDILDYKPFDTPIPFKLDSDDYLEMGGVRKGYYQSGVRRISEEEFQRILSLANIFGSENHEIPLARNRNKGHSYASPETAKKVDDYAIQAATEYLRTKYPNSQIEQMAQNNPGFDILVSDSDQCLYVEVKGTQRLHPHFFMSDGELRFSKENADNYLLIAFHAINLEEKQHKLFTKKGEVCSNSFDMTPIQWSIMAKT